MKQLTKRQAARRDKRGTVLIFAIGALAVISIVAVSYVSIVRIERNSSAAAAAQNNRGESVDVVINRIRDLLAADLFGNKIVTSAVPQDLGFDPQNSIRVWPKMFEDGDYADYPSVDRLDTGLASDPTNITFDTRFFGDRANPPDVSIGSNPWTLDVDPSIPDADPNGIGRRYEVANADDVWLATTEPEYHSQTINEVSLIPWRTITNLRGAYEWVQRENGREVRNSEQQLGLWVRGDGRFVDLAQFFNKSVGVADQPPSNILEFGDAGRVLSVLDPEFGSVLHDGAGALAVTPFSGNNAQTRTSVYQFQMMFMDEFGPAQTPQPRAGMLVPRDPTVPDAMNPPQRDAKDDRFWADTDGDLRPDARWQEIDELGNLANLTWVVAARIIDASSLINVNASIGFDNLGSTNSLNENEIGTGRTPADIDLYRLLERSEDGGGYHNYPDVDVADLSDAFLLEHLPNGLGLTDPMGANLQSIYLDISMDRNVDGQIVPRLTDSLPYAPGNMAVPLDFPVVGRIPTRYLRSAYYEFVGSSPTGHGIASAITYPTRDIYDLMSFWGTNNSSAVSKLEQRLDSPDLFPQAIADYDPAGMTRLGPMRSLEDSRAARVANQGNPRPSVEDLRASVRNAITTVSGVGTFSPVPVLNDNEQYEEQYFVEKVNLRDLADRADAPEDPFNLLDLRRAIRGEDLSDTFASFVWALAPFATDQPYSSAMLAVDPNFQSQPRGAEFHYGGDSVNAVSETASSTLFVDPMTGTRFGTDAGPAVALTTAASLTANLVDAMDSDLDDTFVDLPTVLRILPRELRIQNDADEEIEDSDLTLPIELGLNLPQGEVQPFMMNAPIYGGDMNNLRAYFGLETPRDEVRPFNIATAAATAEDPLRGQGLTVVGLEAQPFITDAITISVYSDASGDGGGADDNGLIDPDGESLGSLFAVRLYNPWPDDIVLDSTYQVVLPDDPGSTTQAQLDPESGFIDSRDLRFQLPGEVIPRGESRVFFWTLGIDSPPWNAELLSAPAGQIIRDAMIASLDMDSPSAPILFADGPRGMATVVDTDDNPPPGSGANLRKAVMFQDLEIAENGAFPASPSHPVLLMRRLADTTRATEVQPGGGARDARWVLIDRLQNSDDPHQLFPAVLPDGVTFGMHAGAGGTHNLDNTDLQEAGFFPGDPMENRDDLGMVSGRVMLMSAISRPKSQNITGFGWPRAVIEEPIANRSTLYWPVDGGTGSAAQRRYFANVWLTGAVPVGSPGDPPPTLHPRESPAYFWFQDRNLVMPVFSLLHSPTLNGTREHYFDDANITGTDANVPPFQLFVPNAPLNTIGELGQLSVYAHTCAGHNLFDLDSWSTVSEKLGLALGVRTFSGSAPFDPYLGVLDPTQYVFDNAANSQGRLGEPPGPGSVSIPDAEGVERFRIPLATRVFDCFEALRTVDNLKQGVINVNTASARVLEMLPFMKPAQDYMTGMGPTLMNGSNALSTRANAIVEYRDRIESVEPITGSNVVTGGPMGADFRLVGNGFDQTGLGIGLRTSPSPGDAGITTIGELSVLDVWDVDLGDPENEGTAMMGSRLFAEIGANTVNEAAAGTSSFLDLTPHSIPNMDPIDDPEERLRIFDAISNVTTVRSDVYLAWFIVRGYDPDEIERIPINTSSVENSMVDVDNPFEPAFERRYLVVLDRSNVRTPTDRPRVLLRFRLPDIR